MCGRFTQQRPVAEVAELFGAEPLADDPGARFNIAPTQDAMIVVERNGDRRVVSYRWGLIPSWSETPSAGSRMFNARAETLRTNSAFRYALRRRRCLVPVDGFFEWRRAGRRREPFLVRREDRTPFALAGLWAGWHDPETGAVTRSFTIVTTRPSGPVAALHDRMPLVLPPEVWSSWLDTNATTQEELDAILAADNPADFELVAIPPLVNDVRNEGPELVEELEIRPSLEPSEATLGLV